MKTAISIPDEVFVAAEGLAEAQVLVAVEKQHLDRALLQPELDG